MKDFFQNFDAFRILKWIFRLSAVFFGFLSELFYYRYILRLFFPVKFENPMQEQFGKIFQELFFYSIFGSMAIAIFFLILSWMLPIWDDNDV